MSPAAKKGKRQPVKSTPKQEGFTAEEKAAMRARARELKAAEAARARCELRLLRWRPTIASSAGASMR